MEKEQNHNKSIQEVIKESIIRIDDLRNIETKRIDDKFKDSDVKYQIQFNAAKEALGIALVAQEKQVAAALDGTKEAINKADVATDKRFELLSEKITSLSDILNKNAGASAIYVTHTDLSAEMEKLRTSFEGMLRPVVTFMNSQTGSGKGRQDMWGYVVGGIFLIIAVASFFIN